MLERAERLHRHFFTHAQAAWEPPVDIVETPEGLVVQMALPGVAADSITIGLDADGISVSALRPFPCADVASRVHRIEIPYGRFERRIGLGTNNFLLVSNALADGVLTLTLRRKESA